ncbi:hypothetical protein VNI00_000127 [Paramarasmius palmivorus]|uniref:Glyoxal oxidase n=1 Tax=Paramarasmius palmivorus TaxID=297713 RepID=A0AAW0EFH1_9AGAR
MLAPSGVLRLSLWLGLSTGSALAATAGSFADGGNTQVSAMMMFVGNNEKVYILDKAESNAAQVNGHSAWGSAWDLNTHQADVMDVRTNVFCAGGMHLPNGSYVTFGGNKAIGPGDTPSSDGQDTFDARLGVWDGRRAIRLVDPCTSSDDWTSSKCQWFDDPNVLAMQKQRWYAAAEPLGDGSIAIIGGYTNGGYINRNYPNDDPATSHGGSEPTYEFFPANGREAAVMNFMIKTSGLNSYAHTYLMPSGKMFVQANYSTILWEPETNVETELPDMPDQIMKRGVTSPFPRVNTWEIPASRDCQRITPEPQDGSAPTYTKDDEMIETRTMGQFIILPDGKLLVVNGGLNGTGRILSSHRPDLIVRDMPYGMSLAAGPVGTPALYDPNASAGSRWSNEGYETSSIPRLYHSSAILLPDASVLIAGSNPNVDVNTSTVFPTEYRAEVFYPHYFSASTRPTPSGIPDRLTYGGDPFDITVPAGSFSGDSNDAAENTHVSVVRPGWTTHGMNMGQRYLQLNNTYTVNEDGSITLHTAQMPPTRTFSSLAPLLYLLL